MERIFQAVCRAAIVAVGMFPFLSPATAGEYSGLDTGGLTKRRSPPFANSVV